jgi:hypothetical protein
MHRRTSCGLLHSSLPPAGSYRQLSSGRAPSMLGVENVAGLENKTIQRQDSLTITSCKHCALFRSARTSHMSMERRGGTAVPRALENKRALLDRRRSLRPLKPPISVTNVVGRKVCRAHCYAMPRFVRYRWHCGGLGHAKFAQDH